MSVYRELHSQDCMSPGLFPWDPRQAYQAHESLGSAPGSEGHGPARPVLWLTWWHLGA